LKKTGENSIINLKEKNNYRKEEKGEILWIDLN